MRTGPRTVPCTPSCINRQSLFLTRTPVVASLFLFALGCIAARAVRARRRQLFEVTQRVASIGVISSAMVSMQCFCFLSFAACFIGVVRKTGATIAALYAHASEWRAFVKKWWYKGSVGRWSSRESTMRNGGGGGTRMAKRQSIQKNKRLAFVMAAAILCAATVTGPMVVRADGKGHYRRSTGTCEAWVSQSDCPGLADGWSGGSWRRTGSWGDYPPRCYYNSGGSYSGIYYNTNTNNDCSADSGRSCICQCPAGRYSDTAVPPEGSCTVCPAGTCVHDEHSHVSFLYFADAV